MDISPYQPPKADVRDVDQNALPDKPAEMRQAAAFLWSSLAIGALNVLLEMYPAQSAEPNWKAWIVPIVTLGVMALLFVCISLGQNWARIVFVLIFVVGAAPYFYVLDQLFAHSVLIGLLSLMQVLLQASAIYLIFTKPGALWFRRRTTL